MGAGSLALLPPTTNTLSLSLPPLPPLFSYIPPPNHKHTPCHTQLAELDEPLQDQMGFIYEGAAIRGAIRQEQRNGYNWVECPMPGASHQIFLQNLKPVNKRRLQRLAKQKQAQQKQQQQGTQAGAHHGRVVLDA